MAVDLAKYLVALEVQNAQYIQKLDQTNKKLDAFHRKQERAVEKIKGAFLKLGTSFAAAFSVRAITQFTAQSIRMADEIAKVARAAGVSAESLQELRFAFGELGGLTSQQVDKSLERFNQQVGFAALGNKRAAGTLKELGVAFQTTSGQARSSEEVLNDALKALAGIESDSRRAGIAARLFGEEAGAKLAASLKGGIDALNQTREATAGMLSDEVIADAELLNDSFERIAKTIGGTVRNAVIETTADMAALLGLIDRGPIGDLRNQLQDVERQIASFEAAAAAGALGANQILLDQARALRKQLQQELFVLQNYDSLVSTPFIQTGEAIAADIVQGFGQRIGTIYDKFPDLKLKVPEINLDLLPEDGLEEIIVNAKPISLDDLIKPFPSAEIDRLFNPIKTKGLEAARVIGQGFRSSFVDWMLDVERDFGELLKRMVAEMAVSGIFDALGTAFSGGTSGFSKFFGSFFGGARADGGPVSAGRSYLVGERGPEIFTPRGAGMISPGGGIAIHMGDTNIDARGATIDLVQRLPKILDDHRQRTKAEIADLIRRNRFATA